jgi:hypothetical protein
VDERLSTRVDASADTVLAALRGRAADAAGIQLGAGDVTAMALQLGDQRVLVVAFDYRARHGSIGIHEADQIVLALQLARSERMPIALLLETSGIRVTDGTAGIASLRRVLREAEDARLDGLPMLGVVLRCAFGGASILAALCERRMIHRHSLYGMSGPRLISATVGAAHFDAADPAVVRSLLGGRARAGPNGCELVGASVEAVTEAVEEWVRSARVESVTAAALIRAGRTLARRLAGAPRPSMPAAAALPDAQGGDVLSVLLPGSRELRRLPDIALAVSDARPETRVLVLEAPDGAGARHALALSEALLEPSPPRRTVILVDTPGHRATPDEERLVLSDFLAHLALTIRFVHRGGDPVEVIVTGVGGGGIQGALGSGATSVAMVRGARLMVLPPAALRALDKEQSSDEGRLDEALHTGAVDAAFPLVA